MRICLVYRSHSHQKLALWQIKRRQKINNIECAIAGGHLNGPRTVNRLENTQ